MPVDQGEIAAPDDCGPPGPAVRIARLVLGFYLIPVVLLVLAVAAIGLAAIAGGRLASRASRSVFPAPHLRIPGSPARLTH